MTGVNFNQSWEMPCSGTSDITQLNTSSNVGTPGLWIFRIDGENIIPACPNEGAHYTVYHILHLYTYLF